MTPEYTEFLAAKAPRPSQCGIEPYPLHKQLFDFQKAATEFCIRQGRAALFLDTGLGKTICELEFALQGGEATNAHSLILTPLAVARQIEAEAARFGYSARVIRDQSEVRAGISICNYDRLDKLDPTAFGCVVLDESSILKAFTGATTRTLIQMFAGTRFKLCATATPAPNDHMELGQHAEFLEIMPSNEMLARWFVSDQTEMGRYRLKRHGEEAFWDWMASWARMAESPEDLGFDGSRFILPPLNVIRHRVAGDVRRSPGSLFVADVSATNMFSIKRQTSAARAAAVGDLVAEAPAEFWIIWVDTNDEADAVMRHLPDAREVRGSQSIEQKEDTIAAFVAGEFGQLVTKASITGHGLNFQHCSRMAFVGRSFSYEQWYQAVRRCWRFGQMHSVDAHIMVAEGEDQIGRVIDRKAGDHATMKRSMAAAMQRDMACASTLKVAYNPTHTAEFVPWIFAA